jgi:hypothetical protein
MQDPPQTSSKHRLLLPYIWVIRMFHSMLSTYTRCSNKCWSYTDHFAMFCHKICKIKASPISGCEGLRDVICWGSHIIYTISSQIGVRLSVLCGGCVLFPRNIFTVSGTHFCKPQSLVWQEQLGMVKKIKDLIRSQTRNLPACSTVPQSTTVPCAPQCLEHIFQFHMNSIFL